jgi:periplasmic copper chaperone A
MNVGAGKFFTIRWLVCGVIAVGCVLGFAPRSAARVVAVPGQVRAGAFVEISIRVLAGCVDGEERKPTRRIEMRVPEGVVFVRPFSVPGWEVSTEVGELAEPVTVNDQTITRGIREVTWRAEDGALAPGHVVDLRLLLRTPPPGTPALRFPTVQYCAGAKTAWTQTPEPDQEDALERPAPTVRLVRARAAQPPGSDQADPPSRLPGDTGILTYISLVAAVGALILALVAFSRAGRDNTRA